ncbi:MAG: hypothetical protein AB7O38_00640 [Pirellulaceae bacterium]
MNLPEPTSTGARIIPPVLRKKLQQCYEHGTKLMHQEKYDHDYAHSILVECVVNDPGNAVYLEAFLQNLQRKYHDNKRGALLAFGGKGPFKKALARKDWAEVVKLGPEILKSNPWDVATLRGLAEACAAQGHGECELRYLRNALDANPRDPEVNKHCAQSLARLGQFDQAIACWTRVDEIKRGDLEAQRMISELQIAKTRGGVVAKGEGGRRAGKPAAVEDGETGAQTPATAAARREIQLTPRQRLEQDLANSPADVDNYLALAQLHIDEDRLGDAAHVLAKALAASGNQLRVQEKVEDVEILRKRQQLAIADRRAEVEGQDAPRELARQLRDDLNRMELEVYDRRSQRYPQDRELQYQLGLRLKRAGNLREAIRCFEQAGTLAERRTAAALEWGECLQRLKQYDKALQQYWSAAEDAAPGQREVRKVALYRIGLLAEGLRNLVDAERALALLRELDPHYKDAATRLDKIQAMRHNQA